MILGALGALLALPATLTAQTTNDPFAEPIAGSWAPILVDYHEFARIVGLGGAAPRMTNLIDEPATQRILVNDMVGTITSISYDGRTVKQYIDLSCTRFEGHFI